MFLTHYKNINRQKLNEYCFSTGGGMTGGYHVERVKRNGENAVISIEEASFHNEAPVKSEYPADVSILDEIEAVVRKYRMNFWHRKKFTNMFVADGASKSYSFEFDKKSISFSSQIYPPRYRKKLKELNEIVNKYMTQYS